MEKFSIRNFGFRKITITNTCWVSTFVSTRLLETRHQNSQVKRNTQLHIHTTKEWRKGDKKRHSSKNQEREHVHEKTKIEGRPTGHRYTGTGQRISILIPEWRFGNGNRKDEQVWKIGNISLRFSRFSPPHEGKSRIVRRGSGWNPSQFLIDAVSVTSEHDLFHFFEVCMSCLRVAGLTGWKKNSFQLFHSSYIVD